MLAPPLHEQIGLPRLTSSGLQACADAVTRLSIHGVLTEAEVHRARTRLMKQIGKAVRAAAKEQ